MTVSNLKLILEQHPTVDSTDGSKQIRDEIKKWRFQQILAQHPWGIPSLEFVRLYKEMYGRDLDVEIKELGYNNLSMMVNNLDTIFTVQHADEVTELIFPNSPYDMVLHDARYGHTFDSTFDTDYQAKPSDYDSIIALANLNRDEPLPNDVVLPGREFVNEYLLPKTLARIEGTRGVHRVILLGGANPSYFFVTFYNDCDKVTEMSYELAEYFNNITAPSDTHIVPNEFIFEGFPCVYHAPEINSWERCLIKAECKKVNKVLIELVDFGGIKTVDRMNLYLMPLPCLDRPKQAICVSLAGLLPKDKKHSDGAGKRLLCFSNTAYKLDCLILEPMVISLETQLNGVQSSASSGNEGFGYRNERIIKNSKDKFNPQVQFEVILCDRNDTDYDLFVDDVLVDETYCLRDETRKQEIENFRDKFKEALKGIERHITEIDVTK